MARMTRPDCAVMRNLIELHTHTPGGGKSGGQTTNTDEMGKKKCGTTYDGRTRI